MQPPIPSAGHVSPDGMWRWDGQRWVLTGAVVPQSTPYTVPAVARPTTSPYGLPGVAATANRSWLAIGGAITALLGTPLVFAACIVPYVYWNDTSNGASASIFDMSSGPGFWYAIEPVIVILLILVAGIVAIALPSKTVRALAAGLLVAVGLQTFAMFMGYTFGELSSGHIGAGGPLGALGGIVAFFGGGLMVGSLFSRA